ncbi:hypothetical protein ACQ1Y9_14585 [Enterococcus faecalis]|uniref:hypothetical protein n=1 Tax=Enterococcus faecalis TaxID=1351 RepID=UPI000FFF6587|nr:hypothetical protein [Enterococcus faecalis]MDT2163638.1 hypothetical protein [Enterococcus faecalis]RXF31400.1 hypothetical protein EG874_14915 [Enterococcus faecalis]
MTKREQKLWRKEMLALMNEDPEWYKKEHTERFQRVQELAEKIETADVRQYYSQITKETFESYQNSGLQFKEIAEEFHITTTALQQWRKDNGYPIYNKNNRK